MHMTGTTPLVQNKNILDRISDFSNRQKIILSHLPPVVSVGKEE
jgi:hypothetical protein